MNQEAKPIIKSLQLEKDEEKSNQLNVCEVFKGTYDTLELTLLRPIVDPLFKVESVGAEVASILTYIAIQHFNPSIILNAGSSGGIIKDQSAQDKVKIGEIMIGQSIEFIDRKNERNPQNQQYIAIQQKLMEIPQDIIDRVILRKGNIGTRDSFDETSGYAHLKNIDCIEMEAASVQRICYFYNIPLILIKAISDVDGLSAEDRQKQFESELQNVSEKLAEKIKTFVEEIFAYSITNTE